VIPKIALKKPDDDAMEEDIADLNPAQLDRGKLKKPTKRAMQYVPNL
jgi:hypothetical protein